MKELLESLIAAIILFGIGTAALKKTHDIVQEAALKKAAQGLPSMTEMNRALFQEK